MVRDTGAGHFDALAHCLQWVRRNCGPHLSTERARNDFGQRLCAAAVSILLGRIGRWSGREIARSTLSLARSAQAERKNESCFFVRAASVYRFIRRYHVKRKSRCDSTLSTFNV
ncbi:hypothetical protein EVAR_53112_1 [Eumeta japonica]|uniref:Uncharacterized protein n=1 Tax=Eumeta variegata TaxID=151549 RepID=A0A4C1YAH5_EUMVA|nr:hypothetical protein EVAR_53112_1 [Eumeta japonica]